MRTLIISIEDDNQPPHRVSSRIDISLVKQALTPSYVVWTKITQLERDLNDKIEALGKQPIPFPKPQ